MGRKTGGSGCGVGRKTGGRARGGSCSVGTGVGCGVGSDVGCGEGSGVGCDVGSGDGCSIGRKTVVGSGDGGRKTGGRKSEASRSVGQRLGQGGGVVRVSDRVQRIGAGVEVKSVKVESRCGKSYEIRLDMDSQ